MNRYKFLEEKHIHTLDGNPLKGNTTVLGVIAKNLTWWAAELAAVEALESGEHIPTIREEYEVVKAIDDPIQRKVAMDNLQKKYPAFKKARFAHYDNKNKKAKKGTDMHEELEKYVKLMISDQNGNPMLMNGYEHESVEIFAKWSIKNVKRFIASEFHCYSEKLWTGAIGDLLYESMKGDLVLMDFKSKKETYRSDYLQDAGIDIMVNENGILDAEGNLVGKIDKTINSYGVYPFGVKDPEPSFYYDVDLAKKVYVATVELDSFINNK